MSSVRNSFRWNIVVAVAALITGLTARATPPAEQTLDELKARISSASTGEKPRLCLLIAQRQLEEADKAYAAVENERGQASLTDALAYTEMARDYAIQAHKNEKQTEIAVRGMIRKLNDMLHTLSHEEQTPLKNAVGRLQHVRDDLLKAMFPKGGAK
jgi:signal transduction histidine kinase